MAGLTPPTPRPRLATLPDVDAAAEAAAGTVLTADGAGRFGFAAGGGGGGGLPRGTVLTTPNGTEATFAGGGEPFDLGLEHFNPPFGGGVSPFEPLWRTDGNGIIVPFDGVLNVGSIVNGEFGADEDTRPEFTLDGVVQPLQAQFPALAFPVLGGQTLGAQWPSFGAAGTYTLRLTLALVETLTPVVYDTAEPI